MDAALRAGIAVHNAGYYHAAHDAWEDEWLALDDGPGERLLHGLIQFTAAVHHARHRNWVGAVGLCESSAGYLADLPADHRDVNVGAVRAYVDALGRDPEFVERAPPQRLEHDGVALELGDLDPPAAIAAAAVLGEELGYDEETFERAADYARTGLVDGELNEFGVLLCDFLTGAKQRALVATRLGQHVQRRKRREDDVSGLFD
jgi:predicted metal-dependent hydrolase